MREGRVERGTAESGWDRVNEWGRKKTHVEIVAMTNFVKIK